MICMQASGLAVAAGSQEQDSYMINASACWYIDYQICTLNSACWVAPMA